MFFRGIVSNLFYDKYAVDSFGMRTAVISSGVIFGMVHLANCISAIAIDS